MESTQELIDRYNRPAIGDESFPTTIKNSPEKHVSPMKTSFRRGSSVSPVKKTRNDYQDHLFRMRGKEKRSVSLSGSPVKQVNQDMRADLTLYDAFEEPSPFKESRGDVFSRISRDDSSVDREIDRFIAHEPYGIEDHTDHVLRDTHKTISSIPPSILASSDGEKYHAVLSASLSKLTREMESLRHENNLLRDRSYSSDYRIRELEARVSQLQVENARLTSEHKAAPIDKSTRRANELLRAKLLKYKRLNDECKMWHGDHNQRLETLVQLLEGALKTRDHDDEQSHGKPTKEKEQAEPAIPSPEALDDENTSMYAKPAPVQNRDLAHAISANNVLYERILAHLDHDPAAARQHQTCENVPMSQCSVCSNPPKPTGTTHDTMQLMGEYKWQLG